MSREEGGVERTPDKGRRTPPVHNCRRQGSDESVNHLAAPGKESRIESDLATSLKTETLVEQDGLFRCCCSVLEPVNVNEKLEAG